MNPYGCNQYFIDSSITADLIHFLIVFTTTQCLYLQVTCKRRAIMITGEIKNKVDAMWTSIWAGGLTNPLSVIEQLTYLIFIRSLDEKELENEQFEAASGIPVPRIFPQSEIGQSMRWSNFKDKDSREAFNIIKNRVFPAIKEMKDGRLPDFDLNGNMIPIEGSDEGDSAFAVYMREAVFDIPTPLVLQKVITDLDNLYDHDIKDLDMLGDLYEYMLSKLSTAGQNGQFRTPKHIREMMVELIAPTPDDTICDPACGTAGFLISSAEYIRSQYESSMSSEQWDHFNSGLFTGFDTDKTMLRISAMNLMLHSIEKPDVRYLDSVSKDNTISNHFTVCLANPPFKGSVNSEIISDSLKSVVNTRVTAVLFVALFLRILKKGGRCACIVPDGILFNSTNAYKALRKKIVDDNKLISVISMPSGVFLPYTDVSTAILIFTKTGAGGTDNVWFYDMKSDGFSLDKSRTPIDSNDIPDVIGRFNNLGNEINRDRTEKSFLVSRQEIVDNDYDLSINKYRKVEYRQETYRPSTEIIDEMIHLNKKIEIDLQNLRKMV